MSQGNEGMVWNTANTQRWTIYRSPTGSVENAYFANSSSQDSFSSSMSDKVPSPDSTNTLGKPYLKIIEEPANQFRFRYKSEMQGTHGAILGEKATKGEKTFPTVKLFNYEGEAVIRCTLYTAENKRRRPHVHRLVGKLSGRAEKDDPHDLRVGQRVDYTASFQNLVIIHTAKKVLVDELLSKKKRIAEARFARKLSIEKSLLEKMRLEAEQDAKGMNMNSVSLKFEAFSLVNQQYIQICDPVYSQPINNMKSHVTGQLRICRLSRFYSSCEGGDEILLFVEKVGKNNIKIRFTEFDDYGNEIWRDYATHVDVHHQFGISCRCPKYKSQDISREVLVQMQLERPSDGATSEARDFVYKPKEYSNTATKRRRLDSAAFSPQIPDSTSKPQMTTFEPLGPTASCAATSSVVLQSSNTDPLLEIREPFQDKDDFVMLKDTQFSSHVLDEAMHVNTNEENASSSISFSAEIGKIPTPPESMIPSVFSSEELQKAFQEEAIAPDYGELVSDSVSTRNLKPPVLLSHLEDLLGDWLSDLNSGVHMSAASASDRGLRVIPNANWESWSIFDELSSAAEASLRSATASDEQIRFQSDIRPQMESPKYAEAQGFRSPDIRPQMESPIYAEAQGFRSPDEDRVRFQMAMPVKREDVLLTLFTAGVQFLQSIVASMQKLISRIQSCNGTHLFAYNAGGPPRKESVEDLFNSIVYLVITDGVEHLQLGVEIIQPILRGMQGLIPIVKRSLSSSSFKEDGFCNSLFENLPQGLQELLLEEPLLRNLLSQNTLRRYELNKSKKENQSKRSLEGDFWISVYENLPDGFKEVLLENIPKTNKQQSTENREKPHQDESKKENVPKSSLKDEARVRPQMGIPRNIPVKREDVLLTLFTAGGEFLQSIVASVQKLISRIQSCNGTYLFAYNAGGPPRKESVEDLFNSIVYLAITDGVAQLQRGVMFVQPMLMALQGLIIPMVKHFLSSSSFKEDGFWNSLFENFPKGFQIMLLNKPLLSYLKNTLRRYELHKSKQFKRSLKRHFWKSVYEDLPEDCREFLLKKIQKLEKQQSTENREKPEKKSSRKKAAKKKASKEKNQDESKKETVSKRSSKVHAKDFAEYSLERLHQIIDTAVLPHVTKSDVEKKILMELETRTAKGDSVLHTAVRYQQFTLLKRLLECIKSHSDDLSPAVNCSNTFNRQTPLHVAVQCNDTDQSRQIVEYLLDLGADPNKSDTSEFTPLHLAVKEKNFHAARCLLEFPGVNINQASADLGTALHIAAEQNSHEMAWLLIQFGADINGIDLQGGQTPLHVAVKKSHVQIVDLLLKQADIDINKEDYRGQTPLQFAILRADTRLMKIVYKLINHGATYESVNIEEGIDDSLESVQEDDTKTMKSKKMQTLAFLFSQISVTENNDSMDDKSEIPQF